MAAIRTMKRSDKQKRTGGLIFSKAAGSKWARGYVCYTTAFFSFAVVWQVFLLFILLCYMDDYGN